MGSGFPRTRTPSHHHPSRARLVGAKRRPTAADTFSHPSAIAQALFVVKWDGREGVFEAQRPDALARLPGVRAARHIDCMVHRSWEDLSFRQLHDIIDEAPPHVVTEAVFEAAVRIRYTNRPQCPNVDGRGVPRSVPLRI